MKKKLKKCLGLDRFHLECCIRDAQVTPTTQYMEGEEILQEHIQVEKKTLRGVHFRNRLLLLLSVIVIFGLVVYSYLTMV